MKRKAPSSSNTPNAQTTETVSKNAPSTSTGPSKRAQQNSVLAKKKDKVPYGYGVYISPETGNTFYSDRASKPIQISSQSSVNAYATRGNKVAPQPPSPSVLTRVAKVKANSPSVLTRGASKAI